MTLSRRLEDARRAFRRGDMQAAAQAHSPASVALVAQEQHGKAGGHYIGNLVYGGLDGIVTTFAVVSGVAGAQLGTRVILIMGLANLFADGFSMAIGAYLSAKSEREYYQREEQRETWEMQHFPEGEKAELEQIYLAQGYPADDARALMEIKTRDPLRWVKAMMVEELGLLSDERSPLLNALATLLAFVVAGALPLLVYLAGLFVTLPPGIGFPVSLALSGVALFGVGAAKVFVTGRNPLVSGMEMLAVGGLAAAVAYGVGALLKGVGG